MPRRRTGLRPSPFTVTTSFRASSTCTSTASTAPIRRIRAIRLRSIAGGCRRTASPRSVRRPWRARRGMLRQVLDQVRRARETPARPLGARPAGASREQFHQPGIPGCAALGLLAQPSGCAAVGSAGGPSRAGGPGGRGGSGRSERLRRRRHPRRDRARGAGCRHRHRRAGARRRARLDSMARGAAGTMCRLDIRRRLTTKRSRGSPPARGSRRTSSTGCRRCITGRPASPVPCCKPTKWRRRSSATASTCTRRWFEPPSPRSGRRG